jgi:hypothetical protein
MKKLRPVKVVVTKTADWLESLLTPNMLRPIAPADKQKVLLAYQAYVQQMAQVHQVDSANTQFVSSNLESLLTLTYNTLQSRGISLCNSLEEFIDVDSIWTIGSK